MQSAHGFQCLLEKHRVISQTPGETSYHIFYMLFAVILKGQLPSILTSSSSLHLDPEMDYKYICQFDRISSDEECDELIEDYTKLTEALLEIGINPDEQLSLMKAISAIVLLGNIVFKRKDGRNDGLDEAECIVDKKSSPVAQISDLLGITSIEDSIVNKVIQGSDRSYGSRSIIWE
jgi:myosin heavy subunit